MISTMLDIRARADSIWDLGPEDECVWEWGERVLTLERAETESPGPYSTRSTPYVREWLECFRDGSVNDVTIMTGSQVSKTLTLMAGMMWTVDNDPGSILWVFPNEHLARSFSESRWLPIVRAGLPMYVPDDSDRLKLLEQYLGASVVTFVGSNSPANLASRPKRIVIQDEVDKFPQAGEREASAVDLADQRTKSFAMPLRVKTSTPTTESGPIWQEFLKGDQRQFWVPCHHCGEFITLEWEQVEWDAGAKVDGGWDLDRVRGSAVYKCQRCGGDIGDGEKSKAVRGGEWLASVRAAAPGHRSYHLPSWYAPWPSSTWGALAVKFLQCKQTWDLKGWDNGVRGLPSRQDGERMEWEVLAARREAFDARIPERVLVLTCGVDVQDDRLEAEIVGWGAGEESWSVEYAVFHGDPARPYLWRDLDNWLLDRDRGRAVDCTCVDSGGHYTSEVYAFCKPRLGRRVYAVRGAPATGKPLVSRPSRSNKGKVPLFSIGTDTAKGLIYARFQIAEYGPGYCHFPSDRDDEFFQQLCAEELRTRYVRGYERREWFLTRRRNEALDCRVYATAALNILPATTLGARELARKRADEPDKETEEKTIQRAHPKGRGRGVRGKSWMSRW